jgi:hypothetical protein
VSGLDAELVRLGYKPSTMLWYRGCWRRVERFFASRGVQDFSLDVAMMWVDQACGGFFDKERAGTLKATDVYLFRVAVMLDDFAVRGAVLRRYSRTVGKLTAGQAEVVSRFQAWLQAAGCAASTVRAYNVWVLTYRWARRAHPNKGKRWVKAGTSPRSTRPGRTAGCSAPATAATTWSSSPGRRSSVTAWSKAVHPSTTRTWANIGPGGDAVTSHH